MRGLAPPIAEVLHVEPGQDRMIRRSRLKTLRRPYSSTRKPNRFSSTSEVCSKTITFRPLRHAATFGPGPSSVSAALPTIRTS